MAKPTSEGCRAQDSCARAPQHFADEPATLAAKLRALYARGPCELSAAELAELFTRHTPRRPRGDERLIRRAHRLLRDTYRERFVEQPRTYGRITLTVVRWIEPKTSQGVDAYTRSSLTGGVVDLRPALDQQATADRARVRVRARRVREPVQRPRRRATRLELPRTPLLERPVSIEAGALTALERAHGPSALAAVLGELHKSRCHAHPAECELAVRTLVLRETPTPLRLFRHLLNAAIGGDLLCDAPAERVRMRAAELEQHDELEPDELEARLAAVRLGGDVEQAAQLEAALGRRRRIPGGSLDPIRIRPQPPPEPAAASDPAEAAARYAEIIAALRVPNTS